MIDEQNLISDPEYWIESINDDIANVHSIRQLIQSVQLPYASKRLGKMNVERVVQLARKKLAQLQVNPLMNLQGETSNAVAKSPVKKLPEKQRRLF